MYQRRPRCTSGFRALRNLWLIYYNTQNLELDYVFSDKNVDSQKYFTYKKCGEFISSRGTNPQILLLDGVDAALIAFQLVIRSARLCSVYSN